MKKLYFACVLFLSFLTLRGQYVSIPDSNFGHWLNQNGFAACMTGNSIAGWQLDTTCPSVLADISMVLPGSFQIYSVEGMQYFKNLKCFRCARNQITALPFLPALLDTFDCSVNNLINIPTLPPSLKYFDCSSNLLTRLPILSDSITTLICSYNPLHNINLLPAKLTYFACIADSLDAISALPRSINSFVCTDNQFTSLPPLPDSLSQFNCSNNIFLRCLPHLNKVGILIFFNTAITCLPNMPSDNYGFGPTVPICTTPCYPLGINEPFGADLQVYPNPTNDMLYISNLPYDAILTISDMTGRVLSAPISHEIDVSALISGVYFLQIQKINGIITKKFVKE